VRNEHQSRIIGIALLAGKISFHSLESVWQAFAARGLDSDPDALLAELEKRGDLGAEDLIGLKAQVRDLERLLEEGDPSGAERDTSRLQPLTGAVLEDPDPVAERTPSQPAGAASRSSTEGLLERRILSVLTLPRWNQYINLKFVAEGGMGRIFRAFDPLLNRPVALKFLRQVDAGAVRGLIEEARNQAQVDHPNICKVYEVKEWQGQVYVAMQFIEGRTLGKLAPGLHTLQKLDLVEQVAEAVHAAHRHGLIHRDLKPANIMVQKSPEGTLHPFVLDFGLARHTAGPGQTQENYVIGTAHYMAPEQARGDSARIDRWTDVYALGVTLYELLTGAPPFHEQVGMDCLVSILKSPIPPPRSVAPSIHPDLQTIVMKCLEKDPARRYGSARALAEDLRRFRDGEPILARPATWSYRLWKFAGRNKSFMVLAAAALAAVLTLAGFGLQARRTAAGRAAWAQHFGQEAERIEALLRYTRLQPAHDIREEMAIVQARIRSIETEMTGSGDLSLGPGHYALGRALLASGEVEQARNHLDLAWSSGFQTREVAYARGRALGQVYAKALEKARGIRDPVLREARIQDLEETLRNPAVDLLRRGQGSLLEPQRFQEGLVASYERRYPEALALASEAVASAPWFYEARSLQASVYLDRSRRETDPAVALAGLDKAGRALAAALHTAPSDPGLLDLQSRRWWEEMVLRRRAGKDVQAASDALQAACATWKVLVPDSPDPEARLAWRDLELARFPGAPPGRLAAAIARAEAAVQNAPGHPEALGALAAGLQVQAYADLNHGRDPRQGLDRAIGLLHRAMEDEMPAFELFEPFAATLWAQVEYEKSRSRNPAAAVEMALSAIQRMAVRYPKVADFDGFLGGIQVELADYQGGHGIDPGPTLRKALVHLDRAAQKAPARYEFHFSRGNAHLVQAQYLLLEGREADLDLEAAGQAYRRAVDCNPAAPGPAYGLGEVGLLRAQSLASRQRSPLEALAAAEAAMAALGKDPRDWRYILFKAQAALARARSSPATARDLLKSAETAAESAVQVGGRQPATLVVAGRVQIAWAELFPAEAQARKARAVRILQEALRQDAAYVPALRLATSLGLRPDAGR
jgi:serine/threonine-protein kinase